MSCFGGKMREYDQISIDRFDNFRGNLNLQSTVYFLSHFHKDHTVGLNTDRFLDRLKSNKNVFLYCTEVTKILMLGDPNFKHLEKYVKTLECDVASRVLVPDEYPDKEEHVTVTMIPAGHCPGSVMFLFEGREGTVLYTGDFRWEGNEVTRIPWFKSGDRVKDIQSVYVDTTFCIPEALHIPSRADCVEALYTLANEWLAESPHNMVHISSKTAYGHEHLLKGVADRLGMKVHVLPAKFQLYEQISELRGIFTPDPSQTRFHACWWAADRQAGSPLPCGHVAPGDMEVRVMTIRPSTMWFIRGVQIKEIYVKTGYLHRVCYSFHSSFSEVRDLVTYLKPRRVFPNVMPMNYTMEQVQKYLNQFLSLHHKEQLISGELSPSKPLGILRKTKRSHPNKGSLSDSEELCFGDSATPQKRRRRSSSASLPSTPGSGVKFRMKYSKFAAEVSPGNSQGQNSQRSKSSDEDITDSQSSYTRSHHSDSELDLTASGDTMDNKYNQGEITHEGSQSLTYMSGDEEDDDYKQFVNQNHLILQSSAEYEKFEALTDHPSYRDNEFLSNDFESKDSYQGKSTETSPETADVQQKNSMAPMESTVNSNEQKSGLKVHPSERQQISEDDFNEDDLLERDFSDEFDEADYDNSEKSLEKKFDEKNSTEICQPRQDRLKSQTRESCSTVQDLPAGQTILLKTKSPGNTESNENIEASQEFECSQEENEEELALQIENSGDSPTENISRTSDVTSPSEFVSEPNAEAQNDYVKSKETPDKSNEKIEFFESDENSKNSLVSEQYVKSTLITDEEEKLLLGNSGDSEHFNQPTKYSKDEESLHSASGGAVHLKYDSSDELLEEGLNLCDKNEVLAKEPIKDSTHSVSNKNVEEHVESVGQDEDGGDKNKSVERVKRFEDNENSEDFSLAEDSQQSDNNEHSSQTFFSDKARLLEEDGNPMSKLLSTQNIDADEINRLQSNQTKECSANSHGEEQSESTRIQANETFCSKKNNIPDLVSPNTSFDEPFGSMGIIAVRSLANASSDCVRTENDSEALDLANERCSQLLENSPEKKAASEDSDETLPPPPEAVSRDGVKSDDSDSDIEVIYSSKSPHTPPETVTILDSPDGKNGTTGTDLADDSKIQETLTQKRSANQTSESEPQSKFPRIRKDYIIKAKEIKISPFIKELTSPKKVLLIDLTLEDSDCEIDDSQGSMSPASDSVEDKSLSPTANSSEDNLNSSNPIGVEATTESSNSLGVEDQLLSSSPVGEKDNSVSVDVAADSNPVDIEENLLLSSPITTDNLGSSNPDEVQDDQMSSNSDSLEDKRLKSNLADDKSASLNHVSDNQESLNSVDLEESFEESSDFVGVQDRIVLSSPITTGLEEYSRSSSPCGVEDRSVSFVGNHDNPVSVCVEDNLVLSSPVGDENSLESSNLVGVEDNVMSSNPFDDESNLNDEDSSEPLNPGGIAGELVSSSSVEGNDGSLNSADFQEMSSKSVDVEDNLESKDLPCTQDYTNSLTNSRFEDKLVPSVPVDDENLVNPDPTGVEEKENPSTHIENKSIPFGGEDNLMSLHLINADGGTVISTPIDTGKNLLSSSPAESGNIM